MSGRVMKEMFLNSIAKVADAFGELNTYRSTSIRAASSSSRDALGCVVSELRMRGGDVQRVGHRQFLLEGDDVRDGAAKVLEQLPLGLRHAAHVAHPHRRQIVGREKVQPADDTQMAQVLPLLAQMGQGERERELEARAEKGGPREQIAEEVAVLERNPLLEVVHGPADLRVGRADGSRIFAGGAAEQSEVVLRVYPHDQVARETDVHTAPIRPVAAIDGDRFGRLVGVGVVQQRNQQPVRRQHRPDLRWDLEDLVHAVVRAKLALADGPYKVHREHLGRDEPFDLFQLGDAEVEGKLVRVQVAGTFDDAARDALGSGGGDLAPVPSSCPWTTYRGKYCIGGWGMSGCVSSMQCTSLISGTRNS
uniref:Uncharacterized protein n=1 Tax=Anopheles atroparvus TaxID=41427 RepID=A0A182IS03_ANOAO